LRDLADSRAKDEADLQTKLAEFDAAYAKLLSPRPDPGNKLGTAQQTLGVLGEQLSFQDRAKMAADFAKEIKKAVDENKKKIAAAAGRCPSRIAQDSASRTMSSKIGGST
jgi:hypothetical protein